MLYPGVPVDEQRLDRVSRFRAGDVYLWASAGAFCLWYFSKACFTKHVEGHGALSAGAPLLLFSQYKLRPVAGWVQDRARIAADQWDINLFGVVGLVPAEGQLAYICAKFFGYGTD